MIVHMVDIRRAKVCSRGARSFFKRHNLDWNNFLQHGIDDQLLLDTGDAMAKKVVEVARGQQ